MSNLKIEPTNWKIMCVQFLPLAFFVFPHFSLLHADRFYDFIVVQVLCDNGVSCSGTLISQEFVMTSASCIEGKRKCGIHVSDIDVATRNNIPIEQTALDLFVHPCYKPGRVESLRYSIGLLRILPFVVKSYYLPVIIDEDGSRDFSDVDSPRVYVWDEPVTEDANILSRAQCVEQNKIFEDAYFICANVDKRKLCPRDLGSSLMCHESSSWTVFGMLAVTPYDMDSKVICESNAGLARGFLRVGFHVEWIDWILNKSYVDVQFPATCERGVKSGFGYTEAASTTGFEPRIAPCSVSFVSFLSFCVVFCN